MKISSLGVPEEWFPDSVLSDAFSRTDFLVSFWFSFFLKRELSNVDQTKAHNYLGPARCADKAVTLSPPIFDEVFSNTPFSRFALSFRSRSTVCGGGGGDGHPK